MNKKISAEVHHALKFTARSCMISHDFFQKLVNGVDGTEKLHEKGEWRMRCLRVTDGEIIE